MIMLSEVIEFLKRTVQVMDLGNNVSLGSIELSFRDGTYYEGEIIAALIIEIIGVPCDHKTGFPKALSSWGVVYKHTGLPSISEPNDNWYDAVLEILWL